ncbi:hypothetical protein BABINDRAFT_160512 [Babjeviella inositovora NRRL Y-12698]|uniref:U3 small nucleolar RNA-associated protein 11 n=1 Tax=Babjeviella inositovora NRRL Y-12698 TaxID=984486 RepID=A0A1E3QTU4_9ASCO|nr:uncharacterized protein BABINDRAFT_160512 [Babjeviella inositovora NRRL Y-12698]ODQ81106.1 hypothetical protein BABINDRAFT_160512 [Babjeviella inositovora NRRL Y-12698]
MKLVHNVQKKQHKERSQPQERAKFGLLEKKKDYKKRAADYHRKEAALKVLKSKVAAHNPDEYYHAMTARKTDGRGILITERGNEALTNDQAKLLKSQDSNYIRTVRNKEQRDVERLTNEILFKSSGKHTVFVKDLKEQKEFDPVKFFNTDESLLDRPENRLRLDQLTNSSKLVKNFDEQTKYSKALIDEKKVKKLKLLQKRKERNDQLRYVEGRMEMQNELMKKGPKMKMRDQNGKTFFKWKAERKR